MTEPSQVGSVSHALPGARRSQLPAESPGRSQWNSHGILPNNRGDFMEKREVIGFSWIFPNKNDSNRIFMGIFPATKSLRRKRGTPIFPESFSRCKSLAVFNGLNICFKIFLTFNVDRRWSLKIVVFSYTLWRGKRKSDQKHACEQQDMDELIKGFKNGYYMFLFIMGNLGSCIIQGKVMGDEKLNS